ncbi:MAG: DUF4190 domain-containing protein [Phycisphaerales bacterium]|nr:MAG: DUF4190 domain-containing protein [Phycisphaerales bacterium]
MMQLENPYADPAAEPPKTSGLAITSLVFSVIFFCPLTTLLGPILGLVALATMGGERPRKGKGLAVAAIVLGLVFTGAQYGAYVLWVKPAIAFLAEYVKFAMTGPDEALATGMAGDIAGFKLHFQGPGATASDDEAQAFLDELRARYGEFTSASMNEQSGQQPTPGQTVLPMPYVLVFELATLDAEAELIFLDEAGQKPVKKLGYIIVFDSSLGDLTYPSKTQEVEKVPDEGRDGN